jgi:hypothetical protein
MYSYSKMDTDTEPKPKSTYNREKYEQNKEKIVSEFVVFSVIILTRRAIISWLIEKKKERERKKV